MTFEEWMRRVDEELSSMVGLESHDLPDGIWWDWWHDALTPKRAARLALRAAGWQDPLPKQRRCGSCGAQFAYREGVHVPFVCDACEQAAVSEWLNGMSE